MKRCLSFPEKLIVIALICAVLTMNCVYSMEDAADASRDALHLANVSVLDSSHQRLMKDIDQSYGGLAQISVMARVGSVANKLTEFERGLQGFADEQHIAQNYVVPGMTSVFDLFLSSVAPLPSVLPRESKITKKDRETLKSLAQMVKRLEFDCLKVRLTIISKNIETSRVRLQVKEKEIKLQNALTRMNLECQENEARLSLMMEALNDIKESYHQLFAVNSSGVSVNAVDGLANCESWDALEDATSGPANAGVVVANTASEQQANRNTVMAETDKDDADIAEAF